MPLIAFQITGLQQAGTEPHRLFVRRLGVLNVEVHVYLLRLAVRPVGRNMLRCELDADPPLAGRVDDAVERLVLKDVPT